MERLDLLFFKSLNMIYHRVMKLDFEVRDLKLSVQIILDYCTKY